MTSWQRGRGRSPAASILGLAVIAWLVIGAIAAGQRHYYSAGTTNCAKAGTVAVTILAGPLNYFGANPRITCHVPQPSK